MTGNSILEMETISRIGFKEKMEFVKRKVLENRRRGFLVDLVN